MPAAPSSPDPDWKTSVEVREDPALAQELAGRMPSASEPRAISVTDLVAPRRAYWRAVAPVRVAPERRERMDKGRELHRRLEFVLASEGTLEARARRDGVVGRIDVLGEVPVEVKSSSNLVAADTLREARLDQIEQLAMYCVLTERRAGRLVTLATDGAPEGSVQVVDVALDATEPVRAEMTRRAETLRRAWDLQAPGELPACRWFDRGCEYQTALACDCRGTEPVPSPAIASHVIELRERPDLAERIAERLRTAPPESPGTKVGRFRELLYPRRAYFQRTVEEPPVEYPPRSPSEPPDLYARLLAAVEGGPVGEVARLAAVSSAPEEEVVGFRGVPFLLRTSRSRPRATALSLLESQPQYALELGFRCGATGTSRARLILGREFASNDADRVQVFDLRFAPVDRFAGLWEARRRQLEVAVRDRAPASLPACPAWMVADCPYRADCGCGAAGDRSQR